MTTVTTLPDRSMPHLPGYTVVEPLYVGSRTAVYRAVPNHNSQTVVIKVLLSDYPTVGELVQFRNQYAITKNLNLSGIVRPLSLQTLGNRYGLVMDDWGGLSLHHYLQQRSLNWAEVLEIALQLANILHELHQQRVIHKDIKPANILIHPESKQVKLIDFSLASLLPKETQEIQSPAILEGTLTHLAPEQTGRMNRGIDYRADFYALGVTLYQLFSGQLPFESDDPLELLHCHIAKTAQPVQHINPAVPGMVGAIVAKLMAKNAEDRYQSALGLHHDLQHCLTQWQATGAIADFELGMRDLSDRFLIPEKLYGRESDIKALLAAFERISHGNSELMLVAGFSGIGKTAVIHEVHKPIVKQHGYFVKGKFDQFNRNIPFSAFVQAFRDLIGQLLGESDAQLANWRAKILSALGENAQVIIEVIPELERLLGQQPTVPELSGTAAQNRFNLLFQKFIGIFTTQDHPLVIFLDDLQWADSASLNLLRLLMSEALTGYLLILGAYRDNEVFPAHPLMLTLGELEQSQSAIQTMTLTPLSESTVNQLVADSLSCDWQLTQPLTELVYRKTNGNPFFTTQFLKALYEDGWIQFQGELGYWQCDMTAVRQLTLTDNVVEFMAKQLQKLPVATQHILKLAACIGNQFDLNTLAIVAEQSLVNTATDLWKALQEGLIIPIDESYKFFQAHDSIGGEHGSEITVSYKFLHDRVQQAAYSLIPEVERATVHYQIGQLLRQQLSPNEQEDRIFELVNYLNYGIAHLRDRSEQGTLAQLNLTAGLKARAATAYQAANNYAQMGIDLLDQTGWQDYSEATLTLHELAAETAFLCGDLAQMEHWIDAVLSHTALPRAQARVYRIRIQAFVAQNDFQSAIATGILALRQFDIHLPIQPSPDDIQQEVQSVLALIGDRPIADLFDLPKMQDPDQIAILGITTSLIPVCYGSNSPLFPIVISLSINRSIEFGNAINSCLAYLCYGILLIIMAQEIDLATQFGRLGYRLAHEPESRKFLSVCLVPVGLFIHHRQSHLQETLPFFQTGYQVGIEMGALEDVGYNAYGFCWNAWWCGRPLAELETQIRTYHQQLLNLNQLATAGYCAVYLETVLRLLGQPDAQLLADEHDRIFEQKKTQNDLLWVYKYYLHHCLTHFLLGEMAQAQEAALQARTYLSAGAATVGEANFYFYDSLICLSNLSTHADRQHQQLQQVIANQSQLHHWASHAPMNYLHQWQLVEAEYRWATGKRLEAIDYYDQAIAGAQENGYIQEAALANELAAQFYLAWGKTTVAAGYLQEAYCCYAKWGARAKTDDLEQRYPHLLRPLLDKTQPLSPIEALTTINTARFPTQTSIGGNRPSHDSNVNATLDLAAVLRASQSLSSAIELDELITQLTQLILQNSGADRCALILSNAEGNWEVRAIATAAETQLCHAPLQDHSELPTKLIYYVKNTQETAIIDSCKTELPVIDEYLRRHSPQSVLCLPILNQGHLIGVLYLQNQVASGVFTNDRLATLQLLTSQAAISLENARLYHQVATYSQTLEAEVKRQTQALHDQNQALEQALQQLQQTQAQLIHVEKMSSLGQLVGGIAHEINNPVNFIKGNVAHAQSYLADLVSLLQLYQQEYPEPTAAIAAKCSEIDLSFLMKDVSRTLNSMESGSDRIRQIVLSLRNFARLGEADRKTVDLHKGIESTLLIVQHRCQATDQQPAICIIKDYGSLPAVTCYPSQLNQVFLHLLNNAIDAIREQSTLNGTPEIRIRTRVTQSGRIRIQIANTHSFIPESIQSQIFNPFFTTKPVGQGSGLGLSVSYSLIQQHQGKLTVKSHPNDGTEFQIDIPKSISNSTELTSSKKGSRSRLQKS